jgi:membrane-bound metal-dependent hydrolase YbcI (DUF457 family)
MQNLLLYVYTSLPFIVVALLCVLAIVAAGVGMVRPRWCSSSRTRPATAR